MEFNVMYGCWGSQAYPNLRAKLTYQQKYKLNDGALRNQINAGSKFKYIGKDPNRHPGERRKFDLTGSELLRLKDRGIPYKNVDLK